MDTVQSFCFKTVKQNLSDTCPLTQQFHFQESLPQRHLNMGTNIPYFIKSKLPYPIKGTMTSCDIKERKDAAILTTPCFHVRLFILYVLKELFQTNPRCTFQKSCITLENHCFWLSFSASQFLPPTNQIMLHRAKQLRLHFFLNLDPSTPGLSSSRFVCLYPLCF